MPKIEITLPAGPAPLAGVKLRASQSDGVIVLSVAPGSDATVLRVHDRVIAVNGIDVNGIQIDDDTAVEELLRLRPTTADSLRLSVSRRHSSAEVLGFSAESEDKLHLAAGTDEASHPSLSYNCSVGGHGVAAGQFTMPCNLLALPDGALVVADGGGCRLQVLSPLGELQHVFGCRGEQAGQLNYPAGLALDGDALIVVDRGNCRLQRLRLDGQPLAVTPLHTTPPSPATAQGAQGAASSRVPLSSPLEASIGNRHVCSLDAASADALSSRRLGSASIDATEGGAPTEGGASSSRDRTPSDTPVTLQDLPVTALDLAHAASGTSSSALKATDLASGGIAPRTPDKPEVASGMLSASHGDAQTAHAQTGSDLLLNYPWGVALVGELIFVTGAPNLPPPPTQPSPTQPSPTPT